MSRPPLSRIAQHLSGEAARLSKELADSEDQQQAIAMATLLMAACVEAYTAGVSYETLAAALRASWRDVKAAADAIKRERLTAPAPATKPDDGSN